MNHPDPELALADVTWLTALARNLVRDEQLADDLVQETCMAAHRSPPARGGVTRAWLGTVLRNFHRRSMRTSSRRARREQAVSKSEALQSTAELVEQAELRRKLSECLLSLEEPFRTTLMRVAFEQQTPAQIAKHEGITTAAVRARLRKARALYKAKLERDYGGDWSAWHAALLPFARLPLPGVDGAPASSPAAPRPEPIAGPSSPLTLGALMSATGMIAATLIVGTGTWLMWPSDPIDPQPSVETAAMAGDPNTTSRADLERTAGLQRELTAAGEVTSSGGNPAERPEGLIRVSGTLMATDDDGPSLVQEGSLFIYVGGERRSVYIREGSWSFECEAGQSLGFEQQAEADDRACLLATDDLAFESLGEDTEISLSGQWPRATSLVVRDADTKAPIRNVFVLPASERTKPQALAKLQPESSPVRIEPTHFGQTRYVVRAEGYGWHRIAVEAFQGGEQEVLLKRGVGELRVLFRGRAGREPLLSVTPTSELGTYSASVGNLYQVGDQDDFTVRNLAPGAYRVEASPGFGSELLGPEVSIEPGSNELVVELPEPETALTGVVTAILTIPAGWDELEREVRLTEYTGGFQGESIVFYANQMEPVAGRKDTWSIDAGRLPVGQWTAEIEDLGWGIPVEIGPFVNTIRIEVPPPGIVDVRITNAATGEPLRGNIPDGSVHSWAPGVRTYGSGTATYDSETQIWRLVAPEGVREVAVMMPGFVGESIDVEFGHEPKQVTVTIQPTYSFVLELYEGDKRIPTDMFWVYMTKVSPAAGTEGKWCGNHAEGAEQAFEVTTPGTYELEFAPIEGYEPIPNARITLESSDLVRHRVQVVRKK